MKRDILLCIDLQAYLQTDDLVDENKPYYGTLTLDDEYHAQFVERPCRAYTRRNMRIFDGRYITLTYRPRDGHIRFNFKDRQPMFLINSDCRRSEKRDSHGTKVLRGQGPRRGEVGGLVINLNYITPPLGES